MAWVRIEDAVTEHRKHLQAGPAACWLWVCGIAYCQRQLSDGFIPDLALTLLGVSSDRRRNEHPIVLANRLVLAGLFDRVDGGYRVHDYHDYNDTREQALERKELIHNQRSRAGHLGGLQSAANRQAKGKQDAAIMLTQQTKQNEAPSHPIPVQRVKNTLCGPPKKPADPRAREFLNWFQDEYKLRRHGADYLVKWEKDTTLVKAMLGATELPRLKLLAQILLSDKTDEEWIVNTDRGIGILSNRFNWLSDRLAEWEAKRAVKA